MGRTEYLLLAVVGALAAFVGVQMVRAPHVQPPAPSSSRAAPAVDSARVMQASSAAGGMLRAGDLSREMLRSAEPAPARNVAEIRERVIAGAPGTYINDVLADDDSMLLRWPDRRISGLRVWVQPRSAVAGWTPGDVDAARNVFDEWLTAGLPLRFDMILDSATADVRVTWIDRFPPSAGQRIGLTRRTNDQYGWIVSAQIIVAVHDSAGRVFTPVELAGIVRHEVGHALGLGHSRDPRTMMYPRATTHQIAPADRATLRLLYTLPPGSLK